MKVKVCPECKTKNDEYATFCKECRSDLGGIPAVEEAFLEPQEEEKEEILEEPITEDSNKTIHYPDPQPLPSPSKGAKIVAEWDNRIEFSLHNNMTIGREGEINLTGWDSGRGISRRHAIFTKRGNQWFIKDTNSANGTSVSGSKLQAGVEKALYDGCQIVFGLTEPKLVFIFQSGDF